MLASEIRHRGSEFGPLGSKFGLVGRETSAYRGRMASETARMAMATDDERLCNSVRGPVIGPEDEGYDEARKIWNGAIDRRPAWIARCTGVADVVAVVRFARERDLLVGVRAGATASAATRSADGGLVIDLSPMKGIHVDPQARTARAEAACSGASSTARPEPSALATEAES